MSNRKTVYLVLAFLMLGAGILYFQHYTYASGTLSQNKSTIDDEFAQFFSDTDEWGFFNSGFEDPFFETEKHMWSHMKKMRERMNRILKDDNFFSDPFESAMGKNIDIEDTGDMLKIHAQLPEGYEAGNVNVKIKNQNILSIQADIEKISEKSENNSEFRSKNIRSYRQIVTLPELVLENSMNVQVKDGKITVEFKKYDGEATVNKENSIYQEPDNYL